MPYWLVNACVDRGWIFATPDYRLMPESSDDEVVQDAVDAYQWVLNSLSMHLDIQVGPVILAGSSAGGYLAMTTASLAGQRPTALLSIYGMLDPLNAIYTTKRANIFGQPHIDIAPVIEQLTVLRPSRPQVLVGYPWPADPSRDPWFAIIATLHIEALFPGSIAGVPGLSEAVAEQGVNAVPPAQRHLFPLSFGESSKFPLTVLFHGKNDSAVSWHLSQVAWEKLCEHGVDVYIEFPPDAEHGFDARTGRVDIERDNADILTAPSFDSLRNVLKSLDQLSKFYNAFMAVNKGKPVETFFTTQNMLYHSAIKRPVSSAYSMTTITDNEWHIDKMMEKLLRYLEAEFYSFGVISKMTCSNSFGFLEQRADIGSMIRSLEADMDHYAPVGKMAWIDNPFRGNPINLYVARKSSTFAKLAVDKTRERRAKPTLSAQEERDFLSRLLKASKTHHQTGHDKEIASYMVTNIVARSDTTAISIRAVLYYLLKTPAACKKLREEIDTADLPDGLLSYTSVERLPYLGACIKEALRVHPAVGLPLERVTPITFQLPNGQSLPAGTVVGMCAWPVHRDLATFGNRVEKHVPERWLKGSDEDEETFNHRVNRMKRADLTFGHGTRTCLGRTIGLIETYETIPTLLRELNIELVEPRAEWTLKNAWFVRQADFKGDCLRTATSTSFS
ncbi:uncharacterized protein Z519_06014 [Cladophialophora bantiana CBS 173.52]|uniref:Alpha/beta hydrolase fold-3 domain-containing protein n=1 Tax=Cladophialophora bantiana (strain ATCC 10958 / CBS 173.52 / CDC B-1940 / NIH 8579) TaxID=1442370 RepID=A0A0D2I9F2_CLAB1|nr:uncharacterized protein Z519_06014 [Cladophialophora bantiana CBS 173.52]KIW93409.1 hypothetical protein Z519_06014 [Cladophialophora bantiana CBS 173.52]